MRARELGKAAWILENLENAYKADVGYAFPEFLIPEVRGTSPLPSSLTRSLTRLNRYPRTG